jgi:hypothetical protein
MQWNYNTSIELNIKISYSRVELKSNKFQKYYQHFIFF